MTSSTHSSTPIQPSVEEEFGEILSPGRDAWNRLRRNPAAVVSGLFILLLVILALFAGTIAPYWYDKANTAGSLPAPPSAGYLLGRDNLGYDVFSRLLFGARVSLSVALVVVLIEAAIGVTLGLWAGYFGEAHQN